MGSAPTDRRWQHRLLQALVLAISGCVAGAPLQIQQAVPEPAVAFVPAQPWTWPIWPTADGSLIGGSGYVTGYDWPWGVTPGLGIGAILFPSILGGSHLVVPGPYPSWKPVLLPRIIWEPTDASPHRADTDSDETAAPSDRVARPSPAPTPSPSRATPPKPPAPDWVGAWTKVGLTAFSAVRQLPLPEAPYLIEPWGPITARPGPIPSPGPGYDVGFPTPDGTPVVTPFITWFQLVGNGFKITLFDLFGRHLFTPLSIRASRLNLPMSVYPPVLLIGPFATSGRLSLVDLLSGGIDTLPELPPVNSTAIFVGANMTQRGETVVYATLRPASPATASNGTPASASDTTSVVQLFDRHTRVIDPLQQLNRFGPLIEPWIDPLGRFIAVTAVRAGLERDILLYDVITGLVDPLPEVNTPEPESVPTLSACARYMAFVRTGPRGRKLYVFDRLTRAIDPLPDLDSFVPIVQGGITQDGYLISITYVKDGQLVRILYDRRTGMIDPLPELNPVGVNRFVDLEREGLIR